MKTRLWITTFAAVGLVACQGESVGPTTAEYEAERARVAAQSGTPAAPAAEAQVDPQDADELGFGGLDATYSYSSDDKRDPFRSFVLDVEQVVASERGPLEQFELNQLSVVAVVWDAEAPRALVQDPSGQGYIVRTGTRLGKNEGHIIKIADGSVVVTETYVDYLGDRTTKDIDMPIRQAQGG